MYFGLFLYSLILHLNLFLLHLLLSFSLLLLVPHELHLLSHLDIHQRDPYLDVRRDPRQEIHQKHRHLVMR